MYVVTFLHNEENENVCAKFYNRLFYFFYRTLTKHLEFILLDSIVLSWPVTEALENKLTLIKC